MAVSPKLALQIAERDRWHCRYTGEPVILPVWFQVRSMLDPTLKYNKNHRTDATDPLAIKHTLQIDHFLDTGPWAPREGHERSVVIGRCNRLVPPRTSAT